MCVIRKAAVVVLCALIAGTPQPGAAETRVDAGIDAGQGAAFLNEDGAKKETGAVDLMFHLQQGASIRVFRGMSEETEILPQNGVYCLDGVRSGAVISYRVSAAGFYTCRRVAVISERDLSRGRKEISCMLDRKSGSGFEPSEILRWPESFEQRIFGIEDLSEVDRSVLHTPAFRGTMAAHQFTSIAEGQAFLKELCLKSSCAQLYHLEGDPACPAVVLTQTDLSDAETLQEAVAAIAENGKLKVLYQAQIHGNEPGAGEGALAVCKTLAQNSSLLANLDVVVVPYVNPAGSKAFTRANGSGMNINRDALRLQTREAQRMHRLFSRLEPEVFIDGHEYRISRVNCKPGETYSVRGVDDVKLAFIEHLNRDRRLCEAERHIGDSTVETLSAKGFRTFYFDPNWDSTTSCNYARMQNSLAFLVETPGIGIGRLGLERRVLAQYETVMSILNMTAADAERIRDMVRTARKDLMKDGRTFSTSDRFVLHHRTDRSRPSALYRKVYDLEGNLLDDSRTERCFNRAESVKTRSRPTAYVIPVSASGAERAAAILTKNGVSCLKLRPGVKLQVSQYTGNLSSARIGKRKTVRFRKGAYVFYLSQPAANIISASFEPDAGDTSAGRGSFLQAGILKKNKTGWPVYRYTGRNPEKNLAKYSKN